MGAFRQYVYRVFLHTTVTAGYQGIRDGQQVLESAAASLAAGDPDMAAKILEPFNLAAAAITAPAQSSPVPASEPRHLEMPTTPPAILPAPPVRLPEPPPPGSQPPRRGPGRPRKHLGANGSQP
jgi:hypothetical protein